MSRKIEVRASGLEAGKNHEDAVHGGKLLFATYEDRCGAFLIRENRLLAVRLETPSEAREGAVYMGQVKDVSEELNACFVRFWGNQIGFLKNNRVPGEYQGLKQGDLIPVSVLAQEQRGKRPALTAKIPWKQIPEGELIREQAKHKAAYSVLVPPKPFYETALNELVEEGEMEEIVVEDPVLFEELQGIAKRLQEPCESSAIVRPNKMEKILARVQLRLYEDPAFPLTKLYSLKTKMEEALRPNLWLKSGVSLYFNYTEAMTVIDVNTGKLRASKGKDREEEFYRINLEAAEEIALQLRLKNISGMVLVDFINMETSEMGDSLMEAMRERTAGDPCQVLVFDMTKLGIMEMTRAKKAKSLREMALEVKNLQKLVEKPK